MTEITVIDHCDCDSMFELTSITMNEEDETNTYNPFFDTTEGDGNTTDDIQVDQDGTIYLRAERAGSSEGRIYTLTYIATNCFGNAASTSATVIVPYNQ